MIDLGTVKPGSTIRIPFSSFDKDDGSSITMTAYAVGDILVYKDGSTTERASDSSETATTDFDSKTGKHLAIIDLADNTTTGFYAAGSEYLVAIDAVTIDAVTTGGWIARFRIGYVGAVLDTTISELGASTNQSVFNLTNGPPEDDVLNGMWAVIHDVAHAYQCAYVVIQDYIGGTKTVILASNPAFGIAATDNFSVMGPAPLQPTTEKLKSVGTSVGINASGHVSRVVLVDTTTTNTDMRGTDSAALAANYTAARAAALDEITAARMATLTDWINGGRLDLILDIIAADVVNLDGAAMRGTDNAALASVCTEARLAELAAANIPADVDTLLSRLTAARALLLDEITAARMARLDENVSAAKTLTAGERDSIAAALLDLANGIESGVTLRQSQRAVAAILAGIISGAGSGTEVFKAIAAASGGTTRVTVTVDASGNRSAITLNL